MHIDSQTLLIIHPPLPRPPINPLPSCSQPPPRSPAKLTAPSSMENDSRLLYNRAGQIPLALSEIEHGERGTGGSLVLPYQRERARSADVTNPPGAHVRCDAGCARCFFTRCTQQNERLTNTNATYSRYHNLNVLQRYESDQNEHSAKGYDDIGGKRAPTQPRCRRARVRCWSMAAAGLLCDLHPPTHTNIAACTQT